jgi:hypothetical protein
MESASGLDLWPRRTTDSPWHAPAEHPTELTPGRAVQSIPVLRVVSAKCQTRPLMVSHAPHSPHGRAASARVQVVLPFNATTHEQRDLSSPSVLIEPYSPVEFFVGANVGRLEGSHGRDWAGHHSGRAPGGVDMTETERDGDGGAVLRHQRLSSSSVTSLSSASPDTAQGRWCPRRPKLSLTLLLRDPPLGEEDGAGVPTRTL